MPDTSIEQHTDAIDAIEDFIKYASKDGMMVRLNNEQYVYNHEDSHLHYKGEPLPMGVAVRVLAQFAQMRLAELGHRIMDLHHEGNYRWTGQFLCERFDTQREMTVTTDSHDYSSALASLFMHTEVLHELFKEMMPPKD